MMISNGRRMIPYDLYQAKKANEPDHLCSLIRKCQHYEILEEAEPNPKIYNIIQKKVNEKKVKQIMKERQKYQISPPDPFIKRTWVSPIDQNSKAQQQFFQRSLKKNERNSIDLQKVKEVCHQLYLNKSLHLYGEFMYSDFSNKQNRRVPTTVKTTEKRIEGLHRQFQKLQSQIKKSIVVCNKGSIYNKKTYVNPLKDDPYFQKIIRNKDEQLVRLLIDSLSFSGTFTFSSYIAFYEIFVWQQVEKGCEIQFVLRVLMGANTEMQLKKLSQMIDFMCSKIYLSNAPDSLKGFSEVMKKLIFRKDFEEVEEEVISRKMLRESLKVNQECLSILINVFYCQ